MNKQIMKVRNQLKVINEMKKPYVSTSELSRTINKMNKVIVYRVQKVLHEDIDYECEYGQEELMSDEILEQIPNIIKNTSYEFIRDLIINDISKIKEYDRLQDELNRLEMDMTIEKMKEKWKEEKSMKEVN